jgi:hypothetical protein
MVPGMAAVETLVAALSSRLADRAQLRIEQMDVLREGFVLTS